MPRSVLRHRVDGNHKQLITDLRKIGMYVIDTAQQGASYDALAVYRGVIAMVEIKDPAALTKMQQVNRVLALTEEERRIMEAVKHNGGCYVIAFTVEDVLKAIEDWKAWE